MIKIDPCSFELYRFKVDAFFETVQCRLRSHAHVTHSHIIMAPTSLLFISAKKVM